MMRFLFIAALLFDLPAHALTPATPIQLNEWLRAAEIDHPKLVPLTTPEVMLALADSRRVRELAPVIENPTSNKDGLIKRQKFRTAIGLALRQLEKDGHLQETAQIDELVFSDARNLAWCLEEPYHAARRLALNKRSRALFRLCETLLLTPWRNHHHNDPERDETGSSFRKLGLESQRLIDLLHEQQLLGDFARLAAERVDRKPDDFKTVQVWIFSELRLKGDSAELWNAFAKAMPNQNTWRRDPLVSFAHFCLQRGIPAPHLHQRAAELVRSAPHAYNRLDGRHAAELDLLAAANAILTSDFKEAIKRQKDAYEAFIALDAKSRAKFIDHHHRLLIDSFADPAIQGPARAWFDALADADMLAELSYGSVSDLWEWALHRESPDTVLGQCRQLAEAARKEISKNPRAFTGGSGFPKELRRHIALMLDAGMVEEATRFHRDLSEISPAQAQGKLPLEGIGKWIEASTKPSQVLLWRDAKDQLMGADHWTQVEEGPRNAALLTSIFPGPGNNGTETGEIWHMRPAQLLKKKVEARRRDGFLTTPIPADRESAYLGLRMDGAAAPAELQVIPSGPNLIPESWITAHRGLPGMNVCVFHHQTRNPRFHEPLNNRKDDTPELMTPIIPLEAAVNYSLTGLLRKAGSEASAEIRVEFLDADGATLQKASVARPSTFNSGPLNFFQVLLVWDNTLGATLRIPVGTKALRLSLSHSGTVAASYEDLVLSRYSLSNPEEIPRERENVDPLATTFLDFDHPVDAIATNSKHNQLAVALGGAGRIHVYSQGENTPQRSLSLPKGVAVPWLASAENGTIATLTLRPQASRPVFYVFAEDGDPVVIPTEHRPLLPTLDRKGRWVLWMDEVEGRRFINFHDLRQPDAETIRRHLDLAEDLEVLFISSIWTNDVFALAGSDIRIDFELPDCRQKRVLDQQKPLGPREFRGFYRTQYGTFLTSRCELNPFPGYIADSQGTMMVNSPGDATIQTLNMRNGQVERSADFSSPVVLALPISLRKGFLERDLLFTLKSDPKRVLRFDRDTLRKIPLTL